MSGTMVDRLKNFLIEIIQKGLKQLIFIHVGNANFQHKYEFIKGALSGLRHFFLKAL